jgi:hypothetical protein
VSVMHKANIVKRRRPGHATALIEVARDIGRSARYIVLQAASRMLPKGGQPRRPGYLLSREEERRFHLHANPVTEGELMGLANAAHPACPMGRVGPFGKALEAASSHWW